jgi:hypothetical protein
MARPKLQQMLMRRGRDLTPNQKTWIPTLDLIDFRPNIGEKGYKNNRLGISLVCAEAAELHFFLYFLLIVVANNEFFRYLSIRLKL